MDEIVLIVEDEEIIRTSLFDALSLEGYKCYQAKSGEEALELLNKVTPDVIISDIMMPGINGYELFAKVKEKKSTMLIPFLFLTAKTDDVSIRKGMNLGADDYIKKPYKLDDLLTSLQSKLKKKKIIYNTINRLGENIARYVPHEFRTPLVSILGNSDLYLEYGNSLSDIEKNELIYSINKSARRLLSRIERFLLYSELEITGKEKYKQLVSERKGTDPSSIDLKTLANDSPEFRERENDLILKIGSANVDILKRDFHFILSELIINACKFSEVGTPISAIGYKKNKKYILKVEDQGCGIDPNELNNVWGFEQINREKNQQVGNGLGLIIIHKLINIYNGKFYITSTLEKSTIAIIELPLLV